MFVCLLSKEAIVFKPLFNLDMQKTYFWWCVVVHPSPGSLLRPAMVSGMLVRPHPAIMAPGQLGFLELIKNPVYSQNFCCLASSCFPRNSPKFLLPSEQAIEWNSIFITGLFQEYSSKYQLILVARMEIY